MAISSIGVGSGLPLDKLLEDIRKSENIPLAQNQQQQILSEARLSAYGIIKGSLTDLQKAAQALNKAETYGTHKATSSFEGMTVSADNTAAAGNYEIKVQNLATSQSLVAAGQASRDENIGAGGSLTVTLANGEEHSIELGDDTSLQGIMKSINADSKLGIQATIINNGSDSNPYQLMITATDTGEEASVSTISFSDENLENAFGFDAANVDASKYEKVTAAQNAKLTVNGIEITSQSNTIDKTIEGITLNLASMPKDGESIKITVTRDDTPAIDGVKNFVKAYNSLLDTIKKQTEFDVDSEKSSVLTGEYLVRNIETRMRSALNSAVGAGAIRSLGDLGITTDYKTGKLEIDDEKLGKAVKENINDVTTFLSGENGLGKTLDTATNDFIKSDGLIKNTTDSIDKNIKMLKEQYDAMSDRIDTKMEGYRRQFSQLDVMVNQMNGISSYLTQQLSMLANMNSNSK